jgi:glutaredoxin
VTKSKWVVLKQDNCRFCEKALWLLEALGIEAEVIDLSTAPQLKDFLKACGLTTVPQIYEDGYLIGGYDDLVQEFGWAGPDE